MRGVPVVVLTIPFASYRELAALFYEMYIGVVAIDTSNYCPSRDGAIAEADDGKPEGVRVSEQIGLPMTPAPITRTCTPPC